MFGFKSAQQKRIDADAVTIAGLREQLELSQDLNRRYAAGQGAYQQEIESLREAAYGADRTAAMYKKLYEGACSTLAQIANQETPTANATVKRMARMARKELPLLHHEVNAPPAKVEAQPANH